jgi:dCMP deaminase
MAKVEHRRVPSRDDKYMGLAFLLSSFSKDPNTQMGAVIVTDDNEPLGCGYNGPPSEMDDEEINWGRTPDESGLTKYDVMIHAEKNAVKFSKASVAGATIYVTGMPCPPCMNYLVNHKIARVIYFPYVSSDNKSMFQQTNAAWLKTQEIARRGNVELLEFKGNLNWIRDKVTEWEDAGIFK